MADFEVRLVELINSESPTRTSLERLIAIGYPGADHLQDCLIGGLDTARILEAPWEIPACKGSPALHAMLEAGFDVAVLEDAESTWPDGR